MYVKNELPLANILLYDVFFKTPKYTPKCQSQKCSIDRAILITPKIHPLLS